MSARQLALLISSVALVAACGGGASPAPSGPAGLPGSSSAPPESPAAGDIEHPTGPTDLVLRLEEGGGFVPLGFLITQAPTFSLYGDGTVVFRNQFAEPMPPGPVIADVPFRTARLSEDQVQSLLAFALSEGGLALARTEYNDPMIADAGTSIFTINAGGIEKVVSVYALSELSDGADAAARTAFWRLSQRLHDFDEGGTIDTAVYEPDRFRGVLYDGAGGAGVAWPWPDVAPDDFVAANDPDRPATGFPSRTMSRAEVEALDLDEFRGGMQGLQLEAPDGTTYSFGLRPLMPDDEA